MVLNQVIFSRVGDHDTEAISGYRIGIFANASAADPLASNDYPKSAALVHQVGELKIDTTEWGNTNPVPEGDYVFRVKSLGPEESESPWGEPSATFTLTNLQPPVVISVS